ncbi:protein kinase [Candidatus Omnitrophota bacterium]
MEKEIGKYKIQREIGKGGMAVVYKAIESGTQKVVALKVLLPTMVDPAMVGRFNREGAAIARLKHSNITQVYDVGMTGGSHYIAMEYVEGDNLKTLIKNKGRFSVEETLKIIAQVADVLAYAHKELMYHRDIKPGNIMITNDGVVKVMDFGLVKMPGVTRITNTGSSMGTPEYMSPEQIDGDEVDSRADIYSLGVTMYEMLTGKTPFQGETFQAIFMKHKQEAPPAMNTICSGIPIEVEKIALKAMAKNMGERYQRAEELRDAINSVCKIPTQVESSTVIVEADTTVKVDQRKKTTKEKKFFPFGVIILIILIAGAAYFGVTHKDTIMTQVKNLFSSEKNVLNDVEEHLAQLESATEHYEQASRLYASGQVNDAIIEYQKALHLRPNYALYHKDLALAYEEKRNVNAALQSWYDVLKYDEDEEYAKFAHERINALKS